MKKVYWRPKAVSRTGLVLIAFTALVGLIMVESVKVKRLQPHYEEKLAATELAAEAYDAISDARMRLGYEVDETMDLTLSGVLGVAMSDVTSLAGDVTAKRTAINPNFAAVTVQMLYDAGVEKGDVVAIGVSGSFPGINTCVYAAAETMGLEPIVIGSGAASQWGANLPDLLWLDMERILVEENLFKTRAIAASIGGFEDRGLGLSEAGLKAIDEGIKRNGLSKLKAESFEDAVEERMALYDKKAGGKPIKAYINVGAGTVSVGRTLGKTMFSPGLNLQPPDRIRQTDGIMPRFILRGVPVIHFAQIADIAEQNGLPVPPLTPPTPGDAAVFEAVDYSKLLAASVLGLLTLMLYGFVRSDIGLRLLKLSKAPKKDVTPEAMV
ncbi:hypothetical protein Pla22_25790 [Rubripirellula amarantea]|uniref:Poly-gamma-glutamate system protein n=1 Tax=Rubripirellula amarantea TaxID=2527999 RepID=A0A5C5WYE6_9BACT|nr:poly-gamma-glutamate system protein [Rubripirellula amarantea]TWT54925.1 hypothetical protein Pla22_25790 [Rubripirellula amarantea]